MVYRKELLNLTNMYQQETRGCAEVDLKDVRSGGKDYKAGQGKIYFHESPHS